MRLAGCGVAALGNTPIAVLHAAKPGDYGWSQSYQDVVNAAQREIEQRERAGAAESRLAQLHAAVSTQLADHDAIMALAEAHRQDSDDVDSYIERLAQLAPVVGEMIDRANTDFNFTQRAKDLTLGWATTLDAIRRGETR